MILKGGIPGVLVKTAGTYGITPAGITVAGNASSPLLNDIDPGDTSTELIWALLTPLVTSGTTQVTDTGGYALIGAAAGTWVQPYRFLAMPQTGSALVGSTNITTVVGGLVPVIVTDPTAQTVDEGTVATFTVVASGSGLSYQWLRNGDEIEGETGTSYALVSMLTDSGASFSVRVTNTAGSVTSASALLTVNLVGGTLIVEDGTGLPDADSYIATVDANLYHANRGNTAWAGLNTLSKEAALRRATDYMLQVYRWRWAGQRKTSTQSLDWPRYEVPMRDAPGGYGTVSAYYDESSVPVAVRNACAELALRAATGDLAPDVGRVAARERIDVIEVEYTAGAAPWVRYRAVDNMLTALFNPSTGNTVTLTRA